MQQTWLALMEGYEETDYGWVYKFGDGYTLEFERLIWDNQMYVGLYKDQSLLTSKVVVTPGYAPLPSLSIPQIIKIALKLIWQKFHHN